MTRPDDRPARQPLLSLVMPCFNEAEIIGPFVGAVLFGMDVPGKFFPEAKNRPVMSCRQHFGRGGTVLNNRGEQHEGRR